MKLFAGPGIDGRVKIAASPCWLLNTYRQIKPDDCEACGLLIGRVLHNGSVVVDEISEPGPTDKRSRFGCTLEDPSHQQMADKLHSDSGGCVGILGHWHTHPEPIPTPSSIDLNDWRRRLQNDVYNDNRLLFVIVGTERTRMWLGSRDGTISELTQVS